ncbi:MAG: type II secretion system F family protein, partial [Candidatus Omnitrophica bacterium]|nr:type II secretion system F family protein [Candidatus Omnitrophota bacterium]
MHRFAYTAKDAAGKRVKGEIQAKDQAVATDILKRKKLTPLAVRQSKEKKPSKMGFGKVPLSEVVIFARQLATMIGAGIPVLQALEIVSEQTDHPKFKFILTDVARRVASGQTIFKSMVQHQKVFTEAFVHIIKAGEESGNLDEILDRVAIYLEKTDQIIRKVKSAMIYPIVVMSMAVAITILMLVKVIPVFVEMYQGFDIELPAPTQFLINASDFMRNNLLMMIIGAVVF